MASVFKPDRIERLFIATAGVGGVLFLAALSFGIFGCGDQTDAASLAIPP